MPGDQLSVVLRETERFFHLLASVIVAKWRLTRCHLTRCCHSMVESPAVPAERERSLLAREKERCKVNESEFVTYVDDNSEVRWLVTELKIS